MNDNHWAKAVVSLSKDVQSSTYTFIATCKNLFIKQIKRVRRRERESDLTRKMQLKTVTS